MSLIGPSELLSVGDFFHEKYGRAAPEPHEVNAWRLAETTQMMNSAPFAITNYFKVADKDGELVRIKPFVFQAILSVCLESQRRRGLAQRVLEDKSRQTGGTTWCLGEALYNSLHPNHKSMILVNDEDVAMAKATVLAGMVNSLPMHMQPKRRIQNLKHLFFDNPNPKQRMYDPGLNSEIQITVPSGMRGTTPHLVIISEYAFMDDARKEEVNTGLLSAMGLRKASCVIIDTTPNGMGDEYHTLVMEAVEANPKWVRRLETTVNITPEEIFAGKLGEPERPDAGWILAYSPFFQHDEYTTRNENPRGEYARISKAQLAEFLTQIGDDPKYGRESEMRLQEMGVSPYRLFWRRKKIDSFQQASQELKLLVFDQEYSTTVSESFVNYEKSPFDRDCLTAVVKHGQEPIARGILREEGGRIGIDTTFHSDWQELRLYAPPETSEQYAIGVDTGGIRYGSLDADAWVCQVLRARDFKVVATYEARVDEFTFCDQLMLLYKWYGYAYTCVELQASGYAVVRRLVDAGMRNYYQWKRLDVDFPEPGEKIYPGWETTFKTRPIMDDWLVSTICHRDPMTGKPEPTVIVPDLKTLSELQSVRRTTSGAIKNDNGHDDHVDALCLAMIAASDPWSGINRKPKEEPKPARMDNFDALGPRRWRSPGAIAAQRRDRNHPDLAQL